MFAPEREFCVFFVIESSIPPAFRAMAILALLTVSAFVFIILFMTGETLLG
jgi:hypothetical protein